jgi:biotin carboxyl carrier protein
VRDVIRVERHLDPAEVSREASPDVPGGLSEDPSPGGPADDPSPGGQPGGPSTGTARDHGPPAAIVDAASLAALTRVADEVLPPLVARLAVSHLGELAVRHGGWQVRIRRAPQVEDGDHAPPAAHAPATAGEHAHGADGAAPPIGSATHGPTAATSPAVGYFVPRRELAVGAHLAQGDLLGWVDVLGVRQEFVAPVDGLVGRLLAEPGDPVEYGQELVHLVPAGTPAADRADPAPADGPGEPAVDRNGEPGSGT